MIPPCIHFRESIQGAPSPRKHPTIIDTMSRIQMLRSKLHSRFSRGRIRQTWLLAQQRNIWLRYRGRATSFLYRSIDEGIDRIATRGVRLYRLVKRLCGATMTFQLGGSYFLRLFVRDRSTIPVNHLKGKMT